MAAGMLGRVLLLALLLAAVSGMLAPPGRAEALDSEEAAFLDLINQYRAANGAGPLQCDDALNASARWMSGDMAEHDYFSHTDLQGRDPITRMAAFGYGYNTWKGENLGAGLETAAMAFSYWKDSPGHNANMLNPSYTVIGIAREFGAGSTFGWYWTTDFGGQSGPLPVAEPASAGWPAPSWAVPRPEPAPPSPVSGVSPPAAAVADPPPVAAPDPSSTWQIADRVQPWWNRLTMMGGADPILATIAYMAGAYLERGGAAAHSTDADLSVSLWPTTFS